MGTLTLPRVLVAGQPENVNHLMEDLNAIRDMLNGNIDAANISNGSITTTQIAASFQALLVPTGAGMEWFTNTPPTGWLICDGSAVSRTTYAALFAVISTTYGAGDGSTTFNLPPHKGRVGVGRDAAQTEFDVLGETGGAKTVAADLAVHNHGFPTSWNVPIGDTAFIPELVDKGTSFYVPRHGSGFISQTNATSNAGNGAGHNNIQPYLTLNYIIKT